MVSINTFLFLLVFFYYNCSVLNLRIALLLHDWIILGCVFIELIYNLPYKERLSCSHRSKFKFCKYVIISKPSIQSCLFILK